MRERPLEDGAGVNRVPVPERALHRIQRGIVRLRAFPCWLAVSALMVGASPAAAVDVTGTTARFTWTPASGPLVGYEVEVSRDGGPFALESTASGDPLEVTIAGTPGETIQLRVRAYDAAGGLGPLSEPSETVTFVGMDPDPPGGDPDPPGGDPDPPGGDPDPPQPGSIPGLTAQRVVRGFSEPVHVTAPEGDERLFVLERRGLVWTVAGGEAFPTPFLDIRARVGMAGEGGLLGMAFDPGHARNGLFYVYYTNRSGNSVLSRFEVGTDPNFADPRNEEVLLTVPQPFADGNGATIAFSPVDGYLYWGLGDGGSTDDPQERAQDGQDLLGKVLRLDVSGGPGAPYSIPADNPFVGDLDVLDEVWALGLRNPARFSFDSQTGHLWIGDVGQRVQELNFQPASDPGGRNYGWDVMEGSACNENDPAPSPPCPDASLTDPLFEYDDAAGDCSITGGEVYRGPLAAARGLYFFADFCSGRVWSLEPGNMDLLDQTAALAPAAGASDQIIAMGKGGFGALYPVHLGGDVYRLGPTGNECLDGVDNDGDGLVDFGADPGCAALDDPSERDSTMPCDDGFDNDRDGRIDFGRDPECTDASAASESGAPGQPPAEPAGVVPLGSMSKALKSSSSKLSCGIGFELVFILPPVMWLRKRRGSRTT
ncbi:MAG: PQQ-dependent sugar dehydrogenase [Myxococcota bacterium]|nr:PQQ-dependent sugar dehydrogenase [Myxococcota bacterium]